MDLNHRNPKMADLQSAGFNPSPNDAFNMAEAIRFGRMDPFESVI